MNRLEINQIKFISGNSDICLVDFVRLVLIVIAKQPVRKYAIFGELNGLILSLEKIFWSELSAWVPYTKKNLTVR